MWFVIENVNTPTGTAEIVTCVEVAVKDVPVKVTVSVATHVEDVTDSVGGIRL
jgi:hypothetical protein